MKLRSTGILPVILMKTWARRPCYDVVRGRTPYEEGRDWELCHDD